MGAVIQVRCLGGAIGLGISSAITNGLLRSRLANKLSAEQLSAVLESVTAISSFTESRGASGIRTGKHESWASSVLSENQVRVCG